VSVNPENLTILATSGEYVTFNIKVSSDHLLSQFIISEKRIGTNETIIFDSAVHYKTFNYVYDYLYPTDYSENVVTLYFKAININGDLFTVKKIIELSNGTLEETSGIKMYTKQSTKESAFNLASLQSISGNSDSTTIDIIDNPLVDNSEKPELRWSSYSGVTFVKFNGFDYPKATTNSIKNAFNSGQTLTEVINIQEEDIILIKTTSNNFGAIKITRIVDNMGVSEDFYEFNIKIGSI
jgi:hypothetical protein